MVKKILSILLWIATAAALVWLFVYAREDYIHTPLKAINLNPETDTGFVSKSALYKEIESFCKEFGRSKEIKAVDMIAIQKMLESNAWIENGSSYIDLDGTLNVSFQEYEPWFRVFGKNGHSVYVTREGFVIPSSRTYTPYVLVTSGNFELRSDSATYQLTDTLECDRNLLNALHWCEAIEGNDFVGHCIGQLYCNKRNQFELTVKGFDGRVIVGDTCDASDKLKRLEIFMKQRIESPETKTLKSINLNYKNQIVCTKR